MTRRLYREDPERLEFEARVVARHDHEGRPAVELDSTAFYPEGGGQPWDTGRLANATVVAVIERNGHVLHVLDRPLATDAVAGRVDAARRRDHTQQHHGQHLLSRAFVETAGASTVGFHLGAEITTIDLDREVDDAAVARAEDLANRIVQEGRAVACRTLSRDEASALGVAAPEEAGDSIRVVDAGGFDVQACSGTHPPRTSGVGAVLVLRRERYKAGSRIGFVCGERARAAARAQRDVLQRVCARLSSPPESLADAVEGLFARLERTDLALAQQRARLVEHEARALRSAASGTPPLVCAALDGWTPAELRELALKVVDAPSAIALLGSREGGRAHLVFARSDDLDHDVVAALGVAADLVGGRGGGRGTIAQGGGGRPEALDAALAAAADAVRTGSP